MTILVDGDIKIMWESLTAIFTSSSGIAFMVLLMIFVTILLFFSKKGYFNISTKAVKIGQDTSTRSLISQQLEYVHSYILSLIPFLQKYTKTEYKLRFILSEIEDVFQYAIVFNNMSNSNAYIESKQIKAYGTIIKYLNKDTDNKYFFSDDFKKYVYDEARNIVTGLVEIKKGDK